MNMDMQYAHSSGPGTGSIIVMLVIAVFLIASMWKIFTKAGKPGWAAIVPIYNIVVLLEIAGKPIWWIVLFFIPIVSLIASIMVAIGLANNFGKGAGFGIGLVLLPPIFYPILGFGSAQYGGSSAPGRLPMARAAY